MLELQILCIHILRTHHVEDFILTSTSFTLFLYSMHMILQMMTLLRPIGIHVIRSLKLYYCCHNLLFSIYFSTQSTLSIELSQFQKNHQKDLAFFFWHKRTESIFPSQKTVSSYLFFPFYVLLMPAFDWKYIYIKWVNQKITSAYSFKFHKFGKPGIANLKSTWVVAMRWHR